MPGMLSKSHSTSASQAAGCALASPVLSADKAMWRRANLPSTQHRSR